jgi:hypothetical protein
MLLSARFPYVTPMGALVRCLEAMSPNTPAEKNTGNNTVSYVVDGGCYKNSGILSILLPRARTPGDPRPLPSSRWLADQDRRTLPAASSILFSIDRSSICSTLMSTATSGACRAWFDPRRRNSKHREARLRAHTWKRQLPGCVTSTKSVSLRPTSTSVCPSKRQSLIWERYCPGT